MRELQDLIKMVSLIAMSVVVTTMTPLWAKAADVDFVDLQYVGMVESSETWSYHEIGDVLNMWSLIYVNNNTGQPQPVWLTVKFYDNISDTYLGGGLDDGLLDPNETAFALETSPEWAMNSENYGTTIRCEISWGRGLIPGAQVVNTVSLYVSFDS